MRFKVDENLPGDVAGLLRAQRFEADTVQEQHLGGTEDQTLAGAVRAEGRVLLTLDLDFSDIRSYPPEQYSGIVVLRPRRQDKGSVLTLVKRLTLALQKENPNGQLWILEPDRIRIRKGG